MQDITRRRAAESRARKAAIRAARRALSERLTPGPGRRQGTKAERSAHLKRSHD